MSLLLTVQLSSVNWAEQLIDLNKTNKSHEDLFSESACLLLFFKYACASNLACGTMWVINVCILYKWLNSLVMCNQCLRLQ